MAILTYSTELQIATSWNNTAGYSLVTALTDADSIPFVLPTPFSNRSRGIPEATHSGQVDLIANDVATWVFPFMTLKQLDYLYTTYYAANESKVTIRTITNSVNATSYDDYNAYIVLPLGISEMASGTPAGIGTLTSGNYRANWLQDVVIGFTIQGASS